MLPVPNLLLYMLLILRSPVGLTPFQKEGWRNGGQGTRCDSEWALAKQTGLGERPAWDAAVEGILWLAAEEEEISLRKAHGDGPRAALAIAVERCHGTVKHCMRLQKGLLRKHLYGQTSGSHGSHCHHFQWPLWSKQQVVGMKPGISQWAAAVRNGVSPMWNRNSLSGALLI